MKKVSAVLIQWKRPLDRILEDLTRYQFIDEVIVWDNRRRNLDVYSRYLAALNAKNDIIYAQDDDCLVKNVRKMYLKFDGSRLVNAMKESHGRETFVGWGAFFKKEWISVLDDYIKIYGKDYFLRFGADMIFTTLLQNEHLTFPADIEEFSSASDPNIAKCQQTDYLNNILTVRARLSGLEALRRSSTKKI